MLITRSSQSHRNLDVKSCSESPPSLDSSAHKNMPALTIPSDKARLDNQSTSPAANRNHERERSESPSRPSYSPITPVLPTATLASGSGSYQYAPPQPSSTITPPQPMAAFNEDGNPDAIALRSAISILQLQRQQSLRDLQILEQRKRDAVADPEGFAQELTAGRISMKNNSVPVSLPTKGQSRVSADSMAEGESSDVEEQSSTTGVSRFGAMPVPQNIVRCPPINWAKYHVVGDSLDKLHDEQRLRPQPGEPEMDEPRRAPVHVVAAPYRPFVDKIVDPPMRTRSITKKG